VGDDAEIIWGQTFDEELGDEMRITVIATGIGSNEPRAAGNIHHFDPTVQPLSHQPREYQQGTYPPSQAAPQQAAQAAHHATGQSARSIARGHLRAPTDEELANWNEFDNPVIVKQKRAVGDDDMINHYTSLPFDNDDLEVPTFLRRKAD
jgi:cell division protein FtsZ